MSQSIYEEVSKMLDIPAKTVEKVYKYYWLFIKDKIENLPLKEDLTEDEFNMLKTNFNIPSVGNLYCTWDKYKKIKNNFNCIKKLKNVTDK